MRIVLVNMPWGSVEIPSLALGILSRSLRARFPDAEVEVLHANIDYVDWLSRESPVTLPDYELFSLHSFATGGGDFVFSSALYDDPDWRWPQLVDAVGGRSERDLALLRRLHRSAPAFVAELAERIVAGRPDLVGFTATFQQTTAALSAAKHIKRLAPEIMTIMGGASCDGPQGTALHRNFDFLDFVQRGEGEVAFPQLVAELAGDRDLAAVSGLCWRDGDRSVANAMSTKPLPPNEIVAPDYDGYFERLASSAARTWTDPKLVMESSRGCWWGEKHHCTFCGLNGSFMEFRSKSPRRFFDEIVELTGRHRVLDIFMVDNILDMNYLTSLLPELAAADHDFRFFCEIKANLRREQVQLLADAGIVNVQAGIENLSSHVLGIMDKGISGCQNVRMLRDAESCGVWVEWNYLYGFPGETVADYASVVAQMPALHHLPPPHSVGRFAVERFSPYFNRPELGFPDLAPDPQYAMMYDLPESELFELAYLFAVPPRGVDEDVAAELAAAVDRWAAAYQSSRLTSADRGDHIELVSERSAFDWRTLTVDDPLELTALRLLDRPHTSAALTRKLADRFPGLGDGAVSALLSHWRELGLLYSDGGQHVSTAPLANNQALTRVSRGARTTWTPSAPLVGSEGRLP
ncbi:RiPP maturation radical SAM C-methyltransferase [Kutzneria sp. 744]|uniref:RiPP maturation radical SAM C-methyltransferase n=1 Tax=Kutzneria sp. (strain 744) TaxID=345341 RepID=UPI0003EEBD19|nr:RiPP maturation radical SAM C-methyltransferase [Kutzneria sp. 744]EWM10510.1 radical SAM domain-containing protein [Kutzneria sp. 744]